MDILPYDCIEYIYKLVHKISLSEVHDELITNVFNKRKSIIYTVPNSNQSIYSEQEFINICKQNYPNSPLSYISDYNGEIDIDLLGHDEDDWEYKYFMQNLERYKTLSDSSTLNIIDWLVFTGAIKFNENHEQVQE
jgi:hypothetical protein